MVILQEQLHFLSHLNYNLHVTMWFFSFFYKVKGSFLSLCIYLFSYKSHHLATFHDSPKYCIVFSLHVTIIYYFLLVHYINSKWKLWSFWLWHKRLKSWWYKKNFAKQVLVSPAFPNQWIISYYLHFFFLSWNMWNIFVFYMNCL